MIEVRPFDGLGRFDNDWLAARYHFSFAGYHDPSRMGLGPLRVWNDDTIQPGTGFDLHRHRDMEIITYVRKGAISHQDHLGNQGRTEAGDVQVMSAGTGILHAEHNLEDETTQIFQIWIEPATAGVRPRWEARRFPKDDRSGELVALASGRPEDETADSEGPLPIHQDAAILGATLKAGQSVTHALGPGRKAYLVPASGRIEVEGQTAEARDGIAIAQVEAVTITALEDSEILLADLG
ncbi:MAG: pirin family protein [Kiloniellales bacterium]|nr:pirin family protein [Kiloniellales bacterium]MDJ0981760.1 pirin family protein [Kiloniellales bacterium]